MLTLSWKRLGLAPSCLLLLLTLSTAHAGPIGNPWYSIEINAWDENYDNVDSLHVFKTSDRDAVDGNLAGGVTLGSYAKPPKQADLSAYVVNGGLPFWVDASSPRHTSTPLPAGTVIGGDVSVDVVQSYRKSSADASISFTYTGAFLELFRDVEFGQPCDGCIRADLSFVAQVFLNSDRSLVSTQTQYASLYDNNGTLALEIGGNDAVNTPWQWTCDDCGSRLFYDGQATLDAPYTGQIDLSGIAFDTSLPPSEQPEFTVQYTLTAIAFDEGRFSGAWAFGRDPLSSDDGGVAFSIDGVLPTDRPILPAVPEPATWALMLAGFGIVAGVARRRRTPGA